MSGKIKQSLIVVLLVKGQGFCDSGKYQEAIEVYEIILAIDPGNIEATKGKGFAVSGLNPSEKNDSMIPNINSITDISDFKLLQIEKRFNQDQITKYELLDELKKQIDERREEIEEELMDALTVVDSNFSVKEDSFIESELIETKSNFLLQDVKNIIFYAEDKDKMMKKIMDTFTFGSVSKLGDIMNLVEDAWNYFPHKALDGLSPVEIKWLKNKN